MRKSRRLRRGPQRIALLAATLVVGLANAVVLARPAEESASTGVRSGPATRSNDGRDDASTARGVEEVQARRRASSLPADFDVDDATRVGDRLVADLGQGTRAELTIDPGLQSHLERQLAQYEVPYGAAVAIDPRTGRVLAFASHSSAEPGFEDVARDASPPAASVFKIVTASALLDRGVRPNTRVCYGGGLHGLSLRDLEDDPARDSRCATLSEAMGSSINAVFAKLADRRLDPATLRRYADAFGYGQSLPFDVRTEASAIDVPTERLEFARTAAGFWHAHLSPLHGALLAATIANDGTMPRASMIERILDADGRVVSSFEARPFRSVIGTETARQVTAMMERTVSSGTARSAFFDAQGVPFLPGIRVAGKTGTLNRERPEYRGYSWFVGFAPANAPTIAVATLVVNSPRWRIKGSYLGREALRYWLVERVRAGARSASAHP